jgi:hypothetical protein
MLDNTLVSRCQRAHNEAVDYEYTVSRAGIRGVLEHLAAELVALDQSRPERLTAHEVARWLLEEVQR